MRDSPVAPDDPAFVGRSRVQNSLSAQPRANTDQKDGFTTDGTLTLFDRLAFLFFNRQIVAGMTAGALKG